MAIFLLFPFGIAKGAEKIGDEKMQQGNEGSNSTAIDDTKNDSNSSSRLKRWGGWGGGTYRYGPCGYGGCRRGGGYGYGGGAYGGGWRRHGYGYGNRGGYYGGGGYGGGYNGGGAAPLFLDWTAPRTGPSPAGANGPYGPFGVGLAGILQGVLFGG